MDEELTFGKWLRHRRRELDLTQDEFARRVGCAPITVRKVESDEMRPSKQLAEAFSNQLGIPLDQHEDFIRMARDEVPHPIADFEGLTVATAQPAELMKRASLSSDAIKLAEIKRSNLPYQLTNFIGRDREITEIKSLLSNARLVTLTGAGGSGKTRIATEIASRILDEFPDGVWLVDFVPIREPGLIQQIIASVLGIQEEPGRALIKTLKDYLYAKKLMLLFDNCEHLISGCAQTADMLLQVCPHLYILATSREPLGIAGENLYKVPTLSLPNVENDTSLDMLAQSESVQVFLDRVRMVKSDFRLTLKNASALAQICRRLDGMPLAIELAAARVRTLDVEHIASHLDDRFALLSSGNRSALPRHQTLRAAMDWSYDLLSENEKTLLARLSIFAGSWTLEVATEVCLVNLEHEKDVLNLLLNLSDKSLVISEEQNGETRYRFLETIREYALEKLSESGEEESLQRRFLDFYTNLAKQAELNYRNKEQLHWFRLMEEERANLRAAFDYGLHKNDFESVKHLIGTAFWLWFFRGSWSEGQFWVESALAKSPKGQDEPEARLLMALGLFHYLQDNYPQAEIALSQSMAIWYELRDPWWSAFVLVFIGLIKRSYDHQAATDLFRESLEYARKSNDSWILAYVMWTIGENELFLENLAEARRFLSESLQFSQIIGDKLLRTEVLRVIGETRDAEGEYFDAIRFYEESLGIMQLFGITTNIATLYNDLGRAAQLSKETDLAAHYFTQAMEWSLRQGKKSSIVLAIAGLGAVAMARGQTRRAVCLFASSTYLSANIGAKSYLFEEGNRQAKWLSGILRSAQAELSEEDFLTANAEGQAMTLERSVSYALQEI